MTPALANSIAFLIVAFTVPAAFIGLVALDERLRRRRNS